MSTLAQIATQAGAAGLYIAGTAPVRSEDGLPDAIRSIVLLGPDEPAFWPIFTASEEYGDGQPDALDRWSRRVVGRIACDAGAKAYFPFGGAPYRPFLGWAVRSGRCWSSPVGLLVHDRAGLFVSFRGGHRAVRGGASRRRAIALRDLCRTALPQRLPGRSPDTSRL